MFLRCLSGLGTTWLGSTRSGNATREQGVALKGDMKDVNKTRDIQICHLQACRETLEKVICDYGYIIYIYIIYIYILYICIYKFM